MPIPRGPADWYLRAEARWRLIMIDLEERGGYVELSKPKWAAELGIPDRSLRGILKRMVQLGVVSITVRGRTATAYGGRDPDRVRLLITWEQWQRNLDTIWLARYRSMHNAYQRGRTKRMRERRKLELAAERIEAALAVADVVAGAVKPIARSEVEGWLDG